ncbi:hypothetical protein F7725_016272 [Dissostichus mawsoni]|uniref:Actin-associated protein FAM107A n=1 Tax=Dissostichus mawsoni TaxID=36200 RepID=A0A7J5Z3A9_DISMA|nr:hypothetical protein F7725_016272 [Dissostichus mawsoni]
MMKMKMSKMLAENHDMNLHQHRFDAVQRREVPAPDYQKGDEDEDLIKPKKLLNPVKASRSHQELHRELMSSCKRISEARIRSHRNSEQTVDQNLHQHRFDAVQRREVPAPDYQKGDEDEDLIKPKKLLNPVKASRSHQELHRELMSSCKRPGEEEAGSDEEEEEEEEKEDEESSPNRCWMECSWKHGSDSNTEEAREILGEEGEKDPTKGQSAEADTLVVLRENEKASDRKEDTSGRWTRLDDGHVWTMDTSGRWTRVDDGHKWRN